LPISNRTGSLSHLRERVGGLEGEGGGVSQLGMCGCAQSSTAPIHALTQCAYRHIPLEEWAGRPWQQPQHDMLHRCTPQVSRPKLCTVSDQARESQHGHTPCASLIALSPTQGTMEY